MKRADAPNWNAEINHGAGKTLSMLLFRMLNMILNAYQPKIYKVTLRALSLEEGAGSAAGAGEPADEAAEAHGEIAERRSGRIVCTRRYAML